MDVCSRAASVSVLLFVYFLDSQMSTILVEQAQPPSHPAAAPSPPLTTVNAGTAASASPRSTNETVVDKVDVDMDASPATPSKAPESAQPSPPPAAQVKAEDMQSVVATAAISNDEPVVAKDQDVVIETADPNATAALDAKQEGVDNNNTTTNTDANKSEPSSPQQILPPPREGTTRKAQLSLAQKRLVVQIQFVENARKKIEDESHPDMQSRLRKLERERDALLAHAKAHEEYLRHTTSVIFAYECDEATSEFEMCCEKLRQDMLEEIHHEMEIINDQRKGAAASGERESRLYHLYACVSCL